MTPEQLPIIEPPAKAKIAKATVLALLVAVVILFAVVLPAEYGIDPLGTGTALELVDLSVGGEVAEGATLDGIVQTGATPQTRPYKVDSRDITLEPGTGIETKYHMEKGASMVYAWKSTGKVEFEFHGEPDEKPNPDYYDSYELENQGGQSHSYGSFTAPSTGIHGWFWENKTSEPVTIHLTTAGFYDSGKLFGADGVSDLQFEDAK